LVGSRGAPPEKLGVCGTADTFVIVTGNDAVAPTGTLPKTRFDGVAEKFCATTAPVGTTRRISAMAT
jgi:hypothetical protein